MEYVVDLQGFQRPINEFVVKELAIISLNDDVPPIVFLFGPPIPWSDLPAKYNSVNLWLERNYHHLPWSAGELSYNDVGNVLRSALHDASTVYTNMHEVMNIYFFLIRKKREGPRQAVAVGGVPSLMQGFSTYCIR